MLLLEPPPVGKIYQKQQTLLSGIPFEVLWMLNERADSWTISLAALGDGNAVPTPVLSGGKLFIGFELLSRCHHPKRPPGRLYVYSVDGSYRHPGANDLGTRCGVVYLDPGETLDA